MGLALPNPPVPLDRTFSFTQSLFKLSSVSFLSHCLQMHWLFILLRLAFSKLQTYLTCGPKTLQISIPFPQTTKILPNAEKDITTTSCTQWMTSLSPQVLNEWHHYHLMRAVNDITTTSCMQWISLPHHACSEWHHCHLMLAYQSLKIILSTPLHPSFLSSQQCFCIWSPPPKYKLSLSLIWSSGD